MNAHEPQDTLPPMTALARRIVKAWGDHGQFTAGGKKRRRLRLPKNKRGGWKHFARNLAIRGVVTAAGLGLIYLTHHLRNRAAAKHSNSIQHTTAKAITPEGLSLEEQLWLMEEVKRLRAAVGEAD